MPRRVHQDTILKSSDGKIRVVELREKTKKELTDLLEEHRKTLAALRVAQIAGGAQTKLTQIRQVRKTIAQILTVTNQQTKHQVRKHYQENKNKKSRPRDLRQKKTRAIRRQLTAKQLSAVTLRQQKKATHFPAQIYAVKAQ